MQPASRIGRTNRPERKPGNPHTPLRAEAAAFFTQGHLPRTARGMAGYLALPSWAIAVSGRRVDPSANTLYPPRRQLPRGAFPGMPEGQIGMALTPGDRFVEVVVPPPHMSPRPPLYKAMTGQLRPHPSRQFDAWDSSRYHSPTSRQPPAAVVMDEGPQPATAAAGPRPLDGVRNPEHALVPIATTHPVVAAAKGPATAGRQCWPVGTTGKVRATPPASRDSSWGGGGRSDAVRGRTSPRWPVGGSPWHSTADAEAEAEFRERGSWVDTGVGGEGRRWGGSSGGPGVHTTARRRETASSSSSSAAARPTRTFAHAQLIRTAGEWVGAPSTPTEGHLMRTTRRMADEWRRHEKRPQPLLTMSMLDGGARAVFYKRKQLGYR
jgi:hypothetical protein